MSLMVGGNGIPCEALFTAPIQKPNFDFMSSFPLNVRVPVIPKEEENWMMMMGGRLKDELLENGGSGSEHMIRGGEDNSVDEPTLRDDETKPKKKCYHRRTVRQIQEMEALYKECQHPDDKQRMRLSQEVGQKPRQVKFWFQNRRIQMKGQQDRSDNAILRAGNVDLKTDNYRLQAALRSVICSSCVGSCMLGETDIDEQQLRLENMSSRV